MCCTKTVAKAAAAADRTRVVARTRNTFDDRFFAGASLRVWNYNQPSHLRHDISYGQTQTTTVNISVRGYLTGTHHD